MSKVYLGVTILLAATSYLSYRHDCGELRALARDVTRECESSTDRALTLTHWVYAQHGFSRNESAFLFPKLRATPLQVLQGGGDCADKSRLLSSMLREVNVPATMAMCFDPVTGIPSHTVVEARIASSEFMVLDPVFDLSFPKQGGAGYHDLLNMRRDNRILTDRLDTLAASLPRKHPVHGYNRRQASYTLASTINWNRNFITRVVHDFLRPRIGKSVYRIPRPVCAEEPKLFVAIGCLFAAFPPLAVLIHDRRRRKRNRCGEERTRSESIPPLPLSEWKNDVAAT